jgi:UPF0271 protein
MGEAFGAWKLGDTEDAALMPFISSANVAAGFHAGDPNLMDSTIRMAAQAGVRVGAHAGYRDLQGFGRRFINAKSDELVNDILYQVGAVREFARRHGLPLQHVKPHGALYMEAAKNEELSKQLVEAMQAIGPELYLFCMDISVTYKIAKQAGQPVVREFFADREYDRSGSIVFVRRMKPLDPKEVADKVVRGCLDGKVRTVEGDDIDIEFDSVCFHSDTPGAFGIAQAIKKAFADNGITVHPLDPPSAH